MRTTQCSRKTNISEFNKLQFDINNLDKNSNYIIRGNLIEKRASIDWLRVKIKNILEFAPDKNKNAIELLHRELAKPKSGYIPTGTLMAYYAAMIGNVSFLDRLLDESPELLCIKILPGFNLALYAATFGQTCILKWIQDNHLTLLRTDKDYGGFYTIAHYAASSGNIDTFKWVKENYPQSLSNEKSVVYFAARTGSAAYVNEVLSIMKSQAQLDMFDFEEQTEEVQNTFLEALKNNYTLTNISFSGGLAEKKNELFKSYIKRNHAIQFAAKKYALFLQAKPDLHEDILSLILRQMLPEGVDEKEIGRIHEEAKPSNRAIAHIKKEIERLEKLDRKSFFQKRKGITQALNELITSITSNYQENMIPLIIDWEIRHHSFLNQTVDFRECFFEVDPKDNPSLKDCILNVKQIFGYDIKPLSQQTLSQSTENYQMNRGIMISLAGAVTLIATIISIPVAILPFSLGLGLAGSAMLIAGIHMIHLASNEPDADVSVDLNPSFALNP